MTDLFKDDDTVTGLELKTKIDLGQIDIKNQVNRFKLEMSDIGITAESKFVLFGGLSHMLYEKHFSNYFTNEVIKARHYSDYSRKDEKWVEEFLGKLGI